ncbi:MAG: competence/damage-inducible protein A [Bacteroidota bacterium]
MTAILLTVGDEILLGQIVDTNAAWLGDRLAASGVNLVRHETVADTMEAITDALARAEADLVVVTGGLGPTHDDLTRDALAQYLGAALHRDDDVMAVLEERYTRRGRVLSKMRKRMADVPDGAEVLPNPKGAAPGLWAEQDGRVFVALPGVPYEMKAIWRESAEQRIDALRPGAVVHRTLLTVGKGESDIAADLGGLAEAPGEGVGLAFLPNLGTVRIRLTAKGEDLEDARRRVDEAAERIRESLGLLVFGEGATTLEAVVGRLLQARGWTVALGESCTGGAAAARLTRIPGASAYVRGGVVAYSNAVKHSALGVPMDLIEAHGAVSEPVALAMARGARDRLGATVGVATTGVAGPSGGSEEKPVGTVWIAYASADDERAVRFVFTDDRALNIGLTTTAVLDLLRRQLL